MTGGTANFVAAATVTSIGSDLTISGGAANFSSGEPINAITLTFSGGELTGSDIVTVSGASTWTGGNMTGTGETITNGALAITGNNQTVAQRTLTINGGATLGGTQLLGQSGGVIINNSLFDIQSDADLLFNSGAPSRPTFINAAGGTVRKSAGAGDSIVSFAFNNTGTVEVQTGTLAFTGSFTLNGGTVNVLSGRLLLGSGGTFQAGLLDIQGGGILNGSGTINADLNNAGTINPGLSPGAVTINGDYTQNAAGALNIEIGGTTSGTQYDQLDVTGIVSLAGALNVSLIDPFVPFRPQSFTIINNDAGDAVSGTFAGLPEGAFFVSGGSSFSISYMGGDGNDVVLSAEDLAPGITVTPTSGLVTTESGGSDTFTVVLDTVPTANVTITLSSSDPTEGTVAPTTLTFTPANALTPQTVTVTGANDDADDGDVAYTIITAAAASQDQDYSGRDAADVSVTNQDNDAAGIAISRTSGLVTTEAGGSDTFTVVLTSTPTSNVTITLSSSDPTEGTVSPTTLTFTPANALTPQTVTVTGVNDTADDGDVAYTIITAAATSGDPGYSGLNAANVTVTNLDDDTAGITVSPTSGLITTEAGGSDTFTVVLDTTPTADVTITLSSSDTSEGTVSPPTLTFTPANALTPQTVTVTGVNDSADDGDVAYTIITAPAVSLDPAYAARNAADVSVTNTDDDPSGGTGSISGTVFLDFDASEIQDPAEPDLAGRTIFLDANRNGQLDTGETSATSDSNGNYSFTGLTPGLHTVRQQLVPDHGVIVTAPSGGSQSVVVLPAVSADVDFGNVLISQIPPVEAVAERFPPSVDAQSAYIVGLYRNLLARDPEAGGLAHWRARLAAGDTREQVARGVWQSEEHRGYQVDRYYSTFLHRGPDVGGRLFWRQALLSGVSEEVVAESFVTSPEYQGAHPIDSDFVLEVYDDILSRRPEAGGQAFWQGALAAGATRAQVAERIVTSSESYLRVIDGYYAAFLHRAGETSGRDFWLSELEGNAQGVERVGERILGGDEYFGGT